MIDFIDMEENRNNRTVEKRMKDCLKNDRARIQVGRISHFGLLEMSRQRIRASVLESTMKPCPHCGGTGHVRSDSSVALMPSSGLIEEFLLKDSRHHITVRTPVATALYVLNHKRSNIVDLENRFGLTITIEADDTVLSQYCVITRGAAVENPVTITPPTLMDMDEGEDEEEIVVEEDEAPEAGEARSRSDNGDDNRRKRRRRRRRGGGRDGERSETDDTQAVSRADDSQPESEADGETNAETNAETEDEAAGDGNDSRRRRRGRRGGRRNRAESQETEAVAEQAADADKSVTEAETVAEAPMAVVEEASVEPAVAEPAASGEENVEKPKPRRRASRRTAKVTHIEEAAEPAIASHQATADVVVEAADEAEKAEPAEMQPDQAAPEQKSAQEPEADAGEGKPRRTGWWQRKSFF